MPSIKSFITCERQSGCPPNQAGRISRRRATAGEEIAHYALTAGGRKFGEIADGIEERVRLPIQVEARPTARSSVGKKARKTLNAMAWEIMPQRGKTRLNVPKGDGKPSLDRHR